MPTPTGLLKKGDRIRHIETGKIFTVTERSGTDIMYSVYLTPVPPNVVPAYGRKNEWLLLECSYWVGKTFEVL
jgi:hypothetical protein